jgi:hypothetical protein
VLSARTIRICIYLLFHEFIERNLPRHLLTPKSNHLYRSNIEIIHHYGNVLRVETSLKLISACKKKVNWAECHDNTFLTSPMDGGEWLPINHFTSGDTDHVNFGWEAWCAREPVWKCLKVKQIAPGIESRLCQILASRNTDRDIPASKYFVSAYNTLPFL